MTRSIHNGNHGRRGFSLVELLVVLLIVLLLIAALLPALGQARRHAKAIECRSNLRQLCLGLMTYATDHKQHFPPNVTMPPPGNLWYDQERVGKYLLARGGVRDGRRGVFACPMDEGAVRSYAMNYWASSKADPPGMVGAGAGRHWKFASGQGSNLILIAEAWSGAFQGAQPESEAVLGARGRTPGLRFGASPGVQPPVMTRFGLASCELPYYRHRLSGRGAPTEPRGRVNLGYADGHVAIKSESDLMNAATGFSRLDSFWSPADPSLQIQP